MKSNHALLKITAIHARILWYIFYKLFSSSLTLNPETCNFYSMQSLQCGKEIMKSDQNTDRMKEKDEDYKNDSSNKKYIISLSYRHLHYSYFGLSLIRCYVMWTCLIV